MITILNTKDSPDLGTYSISPFHRHAMKSLAHGFSEIVFMAAMAIPTFVTDESIHGGESLHSP
jgi:hypothetical protein